MKIGWRERDFEEWFQNVCCLPNDERILLISRQGALKRVVDLVGIDAMGCLVILEVKNESTSRAAVGQAVEYLSHYEGVTVEALDEEYEEVTGRSLREDYAEAFGHSLSTISGQRRVYIVGPRHDAYAAVCADYLSRQLANSGVSFELLVAVRTSDGFTLEPYHVPGLRRSSDLPLGFAQSPMGGVFLLVEPGAHPVVWQVARRDPKLNELRLRKTTSRRTLRIVHRLLMPISPPDEVDLSNAGSVWRHLTRSNRRAKVIGEIAKSADGPATAVVVIAEFEGITFARFRTVPLDRFKDRWKRVDLALPGWREIAIAAAALRDTRRPGAGPSAV